MIWTWPELLAAPCSSEEPGRGNAGGDELVEMSMWYLTLS